MKTYILILVAAVGILPVISAQNPVLDNYIMQGIRANHNLEKQRIGYEKSVSEYNEARGLYLPGLSVHARYSMAEGGRTITFPIRDIFDGYSMVNNIVNSEIDLITPEVFINEDFSFLRRTEHETKLTLSQPLFNTQIYFNIKIRKELTLAEQKEVEISTRQLVDDIRKAYFTYLKAVELHKWLYEAKGLTEEFVRVNERLLENDKITIDALYRARAEDSRIDQEIAEAFRKKQVAGTYFNYLIGQPAGSPILINDTLSLKALISGPDDVVTAALANREELEQLEILDEAANYNIRMSSTNRLPSMFAVADYGFQGEEYRFTGRDDYAMASLVLQWDLFSGFQKKEELHQALLDKRSLETSRLDVLRKIEIEATDGWYGFETAGKIMKTSILEEEAMQKVFDITRRKYENGQAGLLEYTDARIRWTESVMNRIINKYDYYTAYFTILRIMAAE